MNKIVKYSILGIACVLLVFIFIYVKKFILYIAMLLMKVLAGKGVTL